MTTVLQIHINFPVGVSLPAGFERRLSDLVDEVCNAYEAEHQDRVMWPAGHGSKITYMPMTQAEEQAGLHMTFDDSVYAIDVAERERYEGDPYFRGDYDWREATLAVVGYGGWGRKGDWWNR